jgi:hypothetical protein
MKVYCTLCVGSDDELTSGHDPNCPMLIAEDDQIRACVEELLMETSDSADDDLLQIGLDSAAFALYQIRLRKGYY